jgi:hypothetical protein
LDTDRSEVDFGEVRQRQELHHRFTLTNATTDVLHIRDVGTSCGCTVAELPVRELASGTSVTLDVTWDTRSMRGRAAQVVGISFARADSPEPETLVLTLRAEVRPSVRASSDQLEFDRRTPASQSIGFERADGGPLQITSGRSNQEALRVTCEGTKVHVQFDPAVYRPEAGRPTVTVWTDCAEESVVYIPVNIRDALPNGGER